MNNCAMLRNFYSARHNRIVDEVYKFLKPLKKRFRYYNDQFINTVIANIDFDNVVHRRPDIVVIDIINKSSILVEITVCYDLYFDQAYKKKIRRYTLLCDVLEGNGYNVKLVVLCFGSLGSTPLKYFDTCLVF